MRRQDTRSGIVAFLNGPFAGGLPRCRLEFNLDPLPFLRFSLLFFFLQGFPVSSADGDGDSLLHVASMSHNPKLLELLLLLGLDSNVIGYLFIFFKKNYFFCRGIGRR